MHCSSNCIAIIFVVVAGDLELTQHVRINGRSYSCRGLKCTTQPQKRGKGRRPCSRALAAARPRGHSTRKEKEGIRPTDQPEQPRSSSSTAGDQGEVSIGMEVNGKGRLWQSPTKTLGLHPGTGVAVATRPNAVLAAVEYVRRCEEAFEEP